MNLEEFIKTRIESVDELRVLLLFHARPQSDWCAEEIVQNLYLPPALVAVVLPRLVAKGLLSSAGDPPRYRFQPASAEIGGLIDQLAEMDRVRPVSLINLIYDRPKDIQAFADAFKLKKEEGK